MPTVDIVSGLEARCKASRPVFGKADPQAEAKSRRVFDNLR